MRLHMQSYDAIIMMMLMMMMIRLLLLLLLPPPLLLLLLPRLKPAANACKNFPRNIVAILR